MCPQSCFEGTAVDGGTTGDEHRGLLHGCQHLCQGCSTVPWWCRLENKAMALPSAPSAQGTPAPASRTEMVSLWRHITEFRLHAYSSVFCQFLHATLKSWHTSSILTVKKEHVKEKASKYSHLGINNISTFLFAYCFQFSQSLGI